MFRVRITFTFLFLLILLTSPVFSQNNKTESLKRQIDSKIVRCWGIESKSYIVTVNMKAKLQKWSLDNLKVQGELSLEDVHYGSNRVRKLYGNKLLIPSNKKKILGKLINLDEFKKEKIKEIRNPISDTIVLLWSHGNNIVLLGTLHGGLTVYDCNKDEIYYRRYTHPKHSKARDIFFTGGDFSYDKHLVAASKVTGIEYINFSTGEYLWRASGWEGSYNFTIMKKHTIVFVHKKNVIVMNKGEVVSKLKSNVIVATNKNKNLIFTRFSKNVIKVYNIKKKQYVGKLELDFTVHNGNSNKNYLILFGKDGEKRFISRYKITQIIN